MAGVIDTNLLLYAANRDAPEHSAATAFLASAAAMSETWYLTDGVLYEFLRVATHPKVFGRPLAWREGVQFIAALLATGSFTVLTAGETHWRLLSEVLAELTHPAGNLFFDIRTVVLMREYGIRRIYTTDTDFLQFREIQVANPLRA